MRICHGDIIRKHQGDRMGYNGINTHDATLMMQFGNKLKHEAFVPMFWAVK